MRVAVAHKDLSNIPASTASPNPSSFGSQLPPMSDIDAEILALAGGDDSSDEETAPTQPKRVSPSPGSANGHGGGGGDSEPESGEVSRKRSGKHSSRTKRPRNAGDDDAELYVCYLLTHVH